MAGSEIRDCVDRRRPCRHVGELPGYSEGFVVYPARSVRFPAAAEAVLSIHSVCRRLRYATHLPPAATEWRIPPPRTEPEPFRRGPQPPSMCPKKLAPGVPPDLC